MTEGQRWPCGHPRVPENTNKRQCRACKTARQRERYANDPGYAEAERARIRAHYDALGGVNYSWRLLQMRRARAMHRRRQREQGVK